VRPAWAPEPRDEYVLFGAIALTVLGLLVWQECTRRQVNQARLIEAPVARRSLIVTAAIAGPTLLSGLLAAMAASLSSWPFALVCAGLFVAGGAVLWATRKPMGVLRLDADRLLLSYVGDGAATQLELSHPFSLDATVKLPLLLRGNPSMVVTVTQGGSSLRYWFPWTMREIGTPPSAQTAESLPAIRVDWRGAVILERLRALAAGARPPGSP